LHIETLNFSAIYQRIISAAALPVGKGEKTMKQLMTARILRKVMVLAFLLVGLVFVTLSEKTPPVIAAPCCEGCDYTYFQCLQTSSYTYCQNQFRSCVGQCTYCGNGNSICFSDLDCPPDICSCVIESGTSGLCSCY